MVKMPAASMPAPFAATSRGSHLLGSARRNPAAPTTVSRPATTKLVICSQPSEPLLSMLSGCRVRSKPSRVAAWARATAAHSGPATAAQASRERVRVVAVAGTVRAASAVMIGTSSWVRMLRFCRYVGSAM
jgi:hypothetical protein